MERTSDLNIVEILPLLLPVDLKKDLPMTEKSNRVVVEGRKDIVQILQGKDKRLVAVVGPCSIHDPAAAMEYARRLKGLSDRIRDKIVIVMRVYFEKPRTTIGWKGLITDPHMDGSNDIHAGLKVARKLLLDITELGLPCGSEMLDPVIPQYISDLISWAAIGARTTESQTHREMASGLSMPVGFKNGTGGNLKLAVDAMVSAKSPHSFIGIDNNGTASILKTSGNNASHIILRGGSSAPNYYEENVEEAEELIKAVKMPPAIMVDCSHANSGKLYKRQSRVLRSVLDQRSRGRESIVGFMLESNLVEGGQSIPADLSKLTYGQSVTDECIGWEETEELLLGACKAL